LKAGPENPRSPVLSVKEEAMIVAIDRTSKFALVKLVPSTTKMPAAKFLNKLIDTVPYKIHTILDLIMVN